VRALENYRLLVERVERFAAAVTSRHGGQLACRMGCDDCCTHFGVSAVEALALSIAVAQLPHEEGIGLRRRAVNLQQGERCPLLDNGTCLLYPFRPIICRTQGLPLLIDDGGSRRIDHCPLNFQGVESLPGDAVLDLESLNQVLAAINHLCLDELRGQGIILPERLPLAEALQLELEAGD